MEKYKFQGVPVLKLGLKKKEIQKTPEENTKGKCLEVRCHIQKEKNDIRLHRTTFRTKKSFIFSKHLRNEITDSLKMESNWG